MSSGLAPGIAERALPSLEADLTSEKESYRRSAVEFQRRFGKGVYYVSSDKYKELEKAGTLTPEIREAYSLGTAGPSSHFVSGLKFTKALKVEESKMEVLSKVIPLILGGVLAGFLLTYRFHVGVAKDLAFKRIDLFSNQKSDTGTAEKKNAA